MQGILAKWQSHYQKLNSREQLLVKISSAVVLVGSFYWLLWAPLTQAIDKHTHSIATQKTLLQWVQVNANKATQLRASGVSSARFSGSLPQLVNQQAARLNISISRMQPQSDQLLLWVDNAPFNDVLSWLQALEKQGVTILDLDIAEANEPGYIKIRRLQLGKA